jgi:hypothetical protein
VKGEDMFLVCFFSIICLAALFFAVTYFYYEMKTSKLLKTHQQEWDLKKSMLQELGASELDIDEAYTQYCGRLIAHSGFCGACLPRQ